MTKFIQPLRSGQITIPADFREKLDIKPGTLLQVTLIEGELRIKPVETTKTIAKSGWLHELYKYFAPVRDEAKKNFNEKEINSTIDKAVKAVSRKHD